MQANKQISFRCIGYAFYVVIRQYQIVHVCNENTASDIKIK